MSDINLLTERLVLRPLTIEDATVQYLSWLNDPEVNRYLESRFRVHQLKDLSTFIEEVNSDPSAVLLGIFIRQNNKHIGNIKIDSINSYHKHGVIGLMIGDKREWGKGYATESIAAVTQYSLEQLELQKITAGCYEGNLGSKKAFEKVGYQVEGLLRSQVETGEGREGVWQLGILPNEFKV